MFLSIRDDIREALRRVRRNPRLTLFAVGTLALGIGAATAVFTMAHTVLYAAPPFRDADRIVELQGRTPASSSPVAYGLVLDYRSAGVISDGAFSEYTELTWTGQSLPGFDGAEVLRGLSVTPAYFRVFDQPMVLGRGFAGDEGTPGHEAVVLSHSLWQRRFGGRTDIIGQTMTFDGKVHIIVGVAGPRFLTYGRYDVAAWVPFAPMSRLERHSWTCHARLAPGVSFVQAQQRIDTLTAHFVPEVPERFRNAYQNYSVVITPLLAEVDERARPALLALAGAVLCLLLVAAANVASLLLARATADVREIAVRAALGAGRVRLFRMMLVQSIVLALLASVGGVLVATWLLDGARTLMPASVRFEWAFVVDARVFVAAFLVAAVAGLAAGLAPAFESFRLAAGGLRPFVHRSRLLHAIVTAEIALAVCLSVGAGLLVKSFADLVARPLGYQTENLLGMRVRLAGPRYKTVEQKGDYWAQLVERVGALPGVTRASSVSDLPMGWQYIGGGFDVEGATTGASEMAHYIGASPGYFGTLGIPIVAGRAFSDADGALAEPVAIVNDHLAARFWPGQSALGHRVRINRSWLRIVGVVPAIRHAGPQDKYQHEIYLPYRQFNLQTMFLVVRSATPPESLVRSIRGALQSIDPGVPAFEIRTLDQAFSREISTPRFPMVMTTAFAMLALVLAGLGLFGVIAYWVSQRVRELGVRAALGAQPRELRSLVLRQGGRLMTVGVVIGVAAALAVMRLVRSLLYGMSERDPAVYGAAVFTAMLMTLIACWLPAARAARIDPAAALREE